MRIFVQKMTLLIERAEMPGSQSREALTVKG